ncbi:TPA: biopolymer transporter ExbD [Candidatus Poribacteria bacterium]|nr:biopolymer transporter ExbD [Candidatus Poribacteria bacterium]HEX29221.1 biopolymer transporter ExbD [Candidatus Poribacteria bacterium]
MRGMFQQFQERKREEVELPIAPLIDCVFLLLIFFMVATVMRASPPFSVDLPRSQMKEEFPRKKFNLFIGPQGQLALDDMQINNLDDLDRLLSQKAQYIQTLIIKADKAAKHGVVIDVMERAKQRGIDSIAIAVKEESQQ